MTEICEETRTEETLPMLPNIPQEFLNLYIELSPKIRNYFARTFGGIHDAEDLSQETFMKAVRWMSTHAEEIQTFTNPSWIWMIARNTAYDELRRKKAVTMVPLSLFDEMGGIDITLDESDLARMSTGNGIEDIPEQMEAKEIVDAVFAKLNERQKMLIYLRFYLKLSYKEISKMMGINLGGVKNAVHAARDKFISLKEAIDRTHMHR